MTAPFRSNGAASPRALERGYPATRKHRPLPTDLPTPARTVPCPRWRGKRTRPTRVRPGHERLAFSRQEILTAPGMLEYVLDRYVAQILQEHADSRIRGKRKAV